MDNKQEELAQYCYTAADTVYVRSSDNDRWGDATQLSKYSVI